MRSLGQIRPQGEQ